jgi:hypothetical protein
MADILIMQRKQQKTGKACAVNSPGAGKEEIVTNPLTGDLGYISKAAKEDGLEIKPATVARSSRSKAAACRPRRRTLKAHWSARWNR